MLAKKLIFRFITAAVIVFLAGCALTLYRSWSEYTAEAKIQNAFFPLAQALCRYEDDFRSPARSLKQLLPHYISQIPTSRLADSVEYAVIDDGQAWQLTIHSRALSPPRLYLYRSTNKLTPDEQRRVVGENPHGMLVVLREQ
jgi:hypothetical protein